MDFDHIDYCNFCDKDIDTENDIFISFQIIEKGNFICNEAYCSPGCVVKMYTKPGLSILMPNNENKELIKGDVKLNKEKYAKEIQKDIDWLFENTENSYRRNHIVGALKESVNFLYPDLPVELRNDTVFQVGDYAVLQMQNKAEIMITISGMREDKGKIEYLVRMFNLDLWIDSSSFRPMAPGECSSVDKLDKALASLKKRNDS